MTNTTKEHLENLVTAINEDLVEDFIKIDYVDGRPRVVKNGNVNLSSRLSKGQMYDWLSAFYAGMHHKCNPIESK